MKKLPLFLASGLLATIFLASSAAFAAGQGSVWKSQDEYNAYTAMANEKDNQKKVALAEAFLQKFPDSGVKNYVYVAMMNAYQQLNDAPKAIETAKKLLEVDPNNLDALRYLSFAFPFTFKPDSADAASELSRAESDAKHGLDLLSKLQKPANMSDDQFQAALKPVRAIFNSAVAFVAFARKDYPTAITSYKAALEDNPNDLYNIYRLGVAYLSSTPPDHNNGLWYVARAVSLARSGNTADRPAMEKYLKDYFSRLFGCDSGAEDLISQAGSSATPPADLNLDPATKPEPTGSANVDAFNGFTYALKGPAAQAACVWPSLKGQPLQLGGFVNSVEKGADEKTYTVKVALDQSKADSSFDIILEDSTQPTAADLNTGDPVRFQGTISAYTTTPSFSLTLSDAKINDDDLAAASAAAKKKPRKR